MQMFEVHPSARENFDSKAGLLIRLIEKVPRTESQESRFESDVLVAGKITGNEIIGELKEAVSDYRGKSVGRFFIFENQRYGLIDANHEELVNLAEAIQRLAAFREKLSQDFVEECIFSWLKHNFTKVKQSRSFMSLLIEEASNVVKPITVYVPIANTIVEIPFSFCGATIRNLSKTMIDEMAEVGESLPEEDQRNDANKYFDDFRGKYQGYAGVELNLECEPGYANDISINVANKITDLLGIYSGSVLMPDVKCISRIKGTENFSQFTMISRVEGGAPSIQSEISDYASARHWCISKADLNEYEKCGLGTISDLAIKDKVAEFESTVLSMAFLYSKAAFTSDPLEKLVHMLSALESTLLRDENEPIQQNLAERIAVFTSQELSERKAIIKNIKYVYGLRSKYLHHGHQSSDLDELSTFFLRVWLFYVQLVANARKFKSKAEFLDAIDDHKLG